MDIQSLRYAVTLADELHFGRAAGRSFIAAQPFGRRIQILEKELGTALFARTSRRVALTSAGEQILPRIRHALAELDDLMLAVEGEPSESVLRIGVLGFGLADRWPSIRALLDFHHPGLELDYLELDWDDQYNAVRTGRVDVAVVHDVGGAEDLLVEHVMDIARYAVLPTTSDLADADSLSMADLVGRPCLTLAGQPGLAAWVGAEFAFSEVSVHSPTSVPAAVVTTGRIGIHAEPAARFLPLPGVTYLPLEGPAAVVAIASRTSDRRRSVAAFRTAVRAGGTVNHLHEG